VVAPAFYTIPLSGSSTSAPALKKRSTDLRENSISRLTLPPGGAARLYSLPTSGEFRWCVMAAADPERARLESLTRRGGVSTLLTHDEGLTWPDGRGEALAMTVLARGGAVALAFTTMTDALTCKRRLEEEAQ